MSPLSRRAALGQLRRPTVSRPAAALRPFSLSSTRLYPRKDSQDRESINTESTEYSKSGSDDSSAAQEDAAFNTDTTSPREEKKKAGQGNEGNPLEVSPANPEISKPSSETEGGAESAPERKEQSGGGNLKKNG